MSGKVFEREASTYDAWYESPEGSALFEAELDALRPLSSVAGSESLEVGVGSGRFAERLGIAYGVDPAIAPLRIARRRGIESIAATGEQLPFRDSVFATVTFVFTLCFVTDAVRTLQEAVRVLRPNGVVIIGVVPADGPLGQHYQSLGRSGHRIYRYARFFDRPALEQLLRAAGLTEVSIRSAVIRVVDETVVPGPVQDGDQPDAGFLVIAARNTS